MNATQDPRAAADAAWNAERGKPNGAAGGATTFNLTTAADLVATVQVAAEPG